MKIPEELTYDELKYSLSVLSDYNVDDLVIINSKYRFYLAHKESYNGESAIKQLQYRKLTVKERFTIELLRRV